MDQAFENSTTPYTCTAIGSTVTRGITPTTGLPAATAKAFQDHVSSLVDVVDVAAKNPGTAYPQFTRTITESLKSYATGFTKTAATTTVANLKSSTADGSAWVWRILVAFCSFVWIIATHLVIFWYQKFAGIFRWIWDNIVNNIVGTGLKALYIIRLAAYPIVFLPLLIAFLGYRYATGVPAPNQRPPRSAMKGSRPKSAKQPAKKPTFLTPPPPIEVTYPPQAAKNFAVVREQYFGTRLYPLVRAMCKSSAEAKKVTGMLLQASDVQLNRALWDNNFLRNQIAASLTALRLNNMSL